MVENYSLGEAIGLQGRFNIAEQTAQGGIAAINARVKAAQKRRKDDEDYYDRIDAKIVKPRGLHPLFVEPAAVLGTDATARIAKAYSKGGEGFRTEASRIVSELEESYAALERRSGEWKAWDSEYDRAGNYQTKEQKILRQAERSSTSYLDLAQKAKTNNIPGYDPEENLITGRVSYFAPKIATLTTLNTEFNNTSTVQGKPKTVKIGGKDQIVTEEKLFVYNKDAEEYAKLNQVTTPQSIESTSRNLLATQPTFRYQYADELGLDPLDDDALVANMIKTGLKYADETAKFKSAQGFQLSIYNGTDLKGTPAAANKRITQQTVKDNTFFNFGQAFVPIPQIPRFNPSGNTVDGQGVRKTQALSNITPSEIVVLPYTFATDIDKRQYEKPLFIGKGQSLSTMDINKADGFQAYVKMSTASETVYVPADEFADTQYVLGSEEFRNAQLETLKVYKSLGEKIQAYHKVNRSNKDAEFYKLFRAYTQNPSINSDALNKFLDSNF